MNAKFEFKNYEYILRYPRYGKIHTLAQHNTSFHYLTGILPTPTAGVFVHVCTCACLCVCLRVECVCVCVCECMCRLIGLLLTQLSASVCLRERESSLIWRCCCRTRWSGWHTAQSYWYRCTAERRVSRG